MSWNWHNYCMGIIEQVAREKETFTSDDVQARLEHDPSHLNQLGAAFEAAKLKGYITPTGEEVPSERRAAKNRLIHVWKSLLYKQTTLFDMASAPPTGEMQRGDYERPRCKSCGKRHNRRDPFGQHTDRCDRCARKDIISSGP